jgi:alpha-1,2-mannosyltransferase
VVKSHAPQLLLLAAAAAAIPLAEWAWWALFYGNHDFNDFHDYWLAGRLILEGHSPYDMQALRDVARTENLHFMFGGGYSYPLPFALAMVPLALLPFSVSLSVFLAISIAAFGLTVAAWLGWAHGWERATLRRRLGLALLAGFYPPVCGSVANGQANLLLMPLLAGGAAGVLATPPARRAAGGLLVGLAAIVKLVPGVAVVPLAIGRRWGSAAAVVASALGTLVAATLAVPYATQGSGGLAALFDPDSYFTNQSINGFVTRLVRDSDRTAAIWPRGFDPRLPMLMLTAAFGLATLLVLWRARRALATRRGLAIGLALALVAGIAGAPKNSFWNEAFALVGAGLLLAADAPDLRLGRMGRMDLSLLGLWLAGGLLWTVLWMFPPSATAAGLPAVVTLLQSSSLYGMLALWLTLARRLSSAERRAEEAGWAQAAGAGEAKPSAGPSISIA